MSTTFSILGDRSAQQKPPRFEGRIRVGTKVLTRAARENPKVIQIYTRGRQQGLKGPDIEHQIEQQTGLKNPTYPVNTPYFNVNKMDFAMPEIADLILQRFGEVRPGDPETRLYRFPVIFHSEQLGEIYPNSFKQATGQPRHESVYADNGLRYCQYLPEVDPGIIIAQRAKRIKKMPQRQPVTRGPCEPGLCEQYQQGLCKFSGKLLFYIPGIPTTGLVCMETSSMLAAEAIFMALENIQHLLGHIPRFHPDDPKRSVFYLTKVQQQRAYFDDQGQRKTALQWVPTIVADIDITALIKQPPRLLPNTPQQWLAPPSAPDLPSFASPNPAQFPIATETPAPSGQQNEAIPALLNLVADLALDQSKVHTWLEHKLGTNWSQDPQKVLQATTLVTDIGRFGTECAAWWLDIGIESLLQNIVPDKLKTYALARFGKGFAARPADLHALYNTLCQHPEQIDQHADTEPPF